MSNTSKKADKAGFWAEKTSKRGGMLFETKEVAPQPRADALARAKAALDAITDEEDAEITTAALADPDAQPVDDLIRRRGRPTLPADRKKVPVLLKLDPDVVE